jgi:hypothetical protein
VVGALPHLPELNAANNGPVCMLDVLALIVEILLLVGPTSRLRGALSLSVSKSAGVQKRTSEYCCFSCASWGDLARMGVWPQNASEARRIQGASLVESPTQEGQPTWQKGA